MADAADKMQTQITELPRCLMADILSRLPIKTLVKCRCVSKSWLLLFSDPLFVQLQLAKSPTCILTKHILVRKRRVNFWWVVDDDDRFETAAIELPIPPTVGLNSCNGLFCLMEAADRCSDQVWVCNPILGQWITIEPPYYPQHKFWSPSYALGFSPTSNEYKLLCVIGPRMVGDDEYFTAVYTLGTGQWRSLTGEGAGKFQEFTTWFNTCVNGSLHSIYCDSSREVHCISSFNFENEMFGTLPLPPLASDPDPHLQLAVLNGCLSVTVDCYDEENVKIWSMKEYGVEESWTLMLVIVTGSVPNDDLLFSRNGGKKEILMYKSDLRGIDYELLFSLNEEEILMLSVSSSPLVCYNTKRRRCRYPKVPDDYDIWVTAYYPSFVSLHDVVAAEEQVTVQSW